MTEAIRKNAARYFVRRDQAGKITYSGVDEGGPGTGIAENSQVLVVRWPTGKHGAGRGIHAYHQGSTEVLHKDDDDRFTLVISWDNRRAQGRKPALEETAT